MQARLARDTMQANLVDLGMARTRPFAAQGQALKLARAGRKFREVAADLGVSVGRYQNWESGYNRPAPPAWAKLNATLGIDAARLYADVQGNDAPILDPNTVLALIRAAERNLAALRALCAPQATGYHGPERRKPKRGKNAWLAKSVERRSNGQRQ